MVNTGAFGDFESRLTRNSVGQAGGGPVVYTHVQSEAVDSMREIVDKLLKEGKGMMVPGFGEIVISRQDVGQLQVIAGSSPNCFHSGKRIKTGNYHTYLCKVFLTDGKDGRKHIVGGAGRTPLTDTESISLQDMKDIIGLVGEQDFIDGLGLQEGDVLIGEVDGNDRLRALVISLKGGKLKYKMDIRPDMAGVIL